MDFIIACIIYHLFYIILIVLFNLNKIENYIFLIPIFISFLLLYLIKKFENSKKMKKIINLLNNLLLIASFFIYISSV